MQDLAVASSHLLTAGAALLARLRRLGIDVIFANSGTDFPRSSRDWPRRRSGGSTYPRRW